MPILRTAELTLPETLVAKGFNLELDTSQNGTRRFRIGGCFARAIHNARHYATWGRGYTAPGCTGSRVPRCTLWPLCRHSVHGCNAGGVKLGPTREVLHPSTLRNSCLTRSPIGAAVVPIGVTPCHHSTCVTTRKRGEHPTRTAPSRGTTWFMFPSRDISKNGTWGPLVGGTPMASVFDLEAAVGAQWRSFFPGD